MKETRKQKIARQQGYAADRAFNPIRKAMDAGELVMSPVPEPDPCSSLEFCPRCASGPRQLTDLVECPDCGYPKVRKIMRTRRTRT